LKFNDVETIFEEDLTIWVAIMSTTLEVIHKVGKVDTRIDNYVVDILDGCTNEK
jgi:hypothetical protein